ncbi:MAG: endonuclease/exonuclease/phosphatase family protein, partial [Chloroflexi bacterium]|nr:endonuclease/exonuclease/phosphatase family protein [Chloroflexota bacterium]
MKEPLPPTVNWPALGLTALTVLLGAQLLRVFLPALVWHWGANLGLSYWLVVACAYTPTILALAAPALARWLQPRGALWAAGAVLVLCRLLVQLSTTTTIDVWAAMAGTTSFYLLLILLSGQARARGEGGWPAFALGLLFGLALDTALRGLTGTLDLSWIPGLWSLLVVIALVGAFVYTLWQETRAGVPLADAPFSTSLPLIGLGLLLFVQWQLLQSQGWLATLSGWSPAAAFGWLALGNTGALLAAAYTLANERLRSTWWWSLLAGSALVVALAMAAVPGWAAAAGVLVALVSAGLLLAVIAGEARPSSVPAGITRAGFAVWLGLFLFNVFVMLYYFSLAVPLLPFPRAALVPLAGAGLALCAIRAAWRRSPAPGPGALLRPAARLGLLLLLAPAAFWLADSSSAPVEATAHGYPVRVMTYNVRSAYGRAGRQDVEAIAQVIENAGTEVVALQELPRSGMLSGTSDLLSLLARRLDMPYTVMGAATDPVFGNAILSRYPILDSGWDNLPHLDSLIGRGYVWAEIELGGGQTLLVVGAHLSTERAEIRLAQVEALLQAWPPRPRLAFLGDMNARPGSQEIERILDAGFVDAWAETGQAERPRIDWIFHTPDLVASDV